MLICIRVSSNNHKYGILSKTPSVKEIEKFINEDLIIEDQVELIKEVEKVKEDIKKEKLEIIRNGQTIISYQD